MSIQVQQVNYIDACDVIPDVFDDFFSEFLADRQFFWVTNSFSMVSAKEFATELEEYIAMLQEESGDSDKDRDGRDIHLLTEAEKLLSQLPDNVYINLES